MWWSVLSCNVPEFLQHNTDCSAYPDCRDSAPCLHTAFYTFSPRRRPEVFKIEHIFLASDDNKVYLEIPKCSRCLFCFPLRRGLLTFAYINLAYTLCVMGYIAYDCFESNANASRLLLFRGNVFYAEASLLLAVYAVDAVLFVLLLVGTHKKQVMQMKIFLVYGAVSTLAALLVNMCFLPEFFFPVLLLLFCGTLLQMYLLILVRSEIVKLEQEDSIQYLQTTNSTNSFEHTTDLSEVVSPEDPGIENPTAALVSSQTGVSENTNEETVSEK